MQGRVGLVSWGGCPLKGTPVAPAIISAVSCPFSFPLTWPHLLLQLLHPSRRMEEPGRIIALSFCPHSSALCGSLQGSGFQGSPCRGSWPGPALLSPRPLISSAFRVSSHFPVSGLLSSSSKLSLEFRLQGLLQGDHGLHPELVTALSWFLGQITGPTLR